MTAYNSTEVSSEEEKKDRIKELEAQLAALRNDEEYEIKMTDYIRVMSLFAGHLNVSTQERGGGKVFRFEDFGTTKRMLYSELIDVLEAYSKFAEFGYFIILDPRVIRNHGLEDAYAKILTKEKIERIIAGSPDAHDLFAVCNPKQQEQIVSMLVGKLRDNADSLDLNMVDRISRLSNVDIAKKAKESREYFAADKEEAEGTKAPAR